MAIEIGKIRNVGVVGHRGVGTTSLVEAMLFAAGAVTRLGRVDDGSTTTDFDPDEIRRKISINTSVAYCDWKSHHVNLVDTPGYGDFIADARAGLRVVEAAVVIVDAVSGVQVQTEKVWKFATEYNLPRVVVVNRLDRERADFFRTFESLGKRLKGRLVALHVPIGEESAFRGFVDLVKMKAVTLSGNKPAEGEIPADLAARAKEYREKLVEAAAETDDDLLAKYLEEGSLGEPEMLKALRMGISEGKLMPVVCAAASKSIGVPQKLKETQTGDTPTEEAQPFELPKITFPEAAISFAIQPKTRGDEDKISNALARIAEEDPTVHYHFDPETKQLLVSGVGSLHVEMVVERMKRKYNVEVNLLPPRIPYKETVKGRAEGQGKYKKQTGGRGQYGDTWLRVEPMQRGGGFEFADEVFGGAVPRNFIPSVEKGVRECMKKGILAGYPVVDMKVTLYDGSYHDVDSSDMAFQIAASMGLQKVFMEARPILLEPIMNVEVSTPAEVAGDIIGDLNSRRGRINGMEPAGETATVRASAPMSEMLTYESSLRSMTGGRGGYSMEFSHYEEVPAFQADKIVKEAKAEKEKAAGH